MIRFTWLISGTFVLNNTWNVLQSPLRGMAEELFAEEDYETGQVIRAIWGLGMFLMGYLEKL